MIQSVPGIVKGCRGSTLVLRSGLIEFFSVCMNMPDGNQVAEPSRSRHYAANGLTRIFTARHFSTELSDIFSLILMQYAQIALFRLNSNLSFSATRYSVCVHSLNTIFCYLQIFRKGSLFPKSCNLKSGKNHATLFYILFLTTKGKRRLWGFPGNNTRRFFASFCVVFFSVR